jgi:hypothetical protein
MFSLVPSMVCRRCWVESGVSSGEASGTKMMLSPLYDEGALLDEGAFNDEGAFSDEANEGLV